MRKIGIHYMLVSDNILPQDIGNQKNMLPHIVLSVVSDE